MIAIALEGDSPLEYLSPTLALIESHGRILVYDRIRGGGVVVGVPHSAMISGLIARNGTKEDLAEIRVEPKTWQPILKLFREHGFLWRQPEPPPDPRLDPARVASGHYVRQLSLMAVVKCNYACKNCFVFNEPANHFVHSDLYMRWETAEEALSKFFFDLRSDPSAADQRVVRLFGGEPFLNWELIEKTIRWIRSRGLRCRIYITTNGSLLDRQRAEFLTQNEVTLFISLNGIRELNDRVRVDHSGRSTYDRSLKGLAAQMETGKETHLSLTVQNEDSILRLPELINLLDRMRPNPQHRIVIYMSLMKGLVEETRFRVPEAELCSRLADSWVAATARNIYFGGRLFQNFRNVFQTPEKFDRWCERGVGVVVYPSGEVRPCSGTSHRIGNLADFPQLLAGDDFRSVSRRLGGQIPDCTGCSVEGLCGGSCACSSHAGLGDYHAGINCDFERLFFQEAVKTYLSVYNQTLVN